MSLTPQTQARVSEETMTTVDTVHSILKSKGSDVWSVAPEATVYDAIAAMAEKGVGALLVVSEGKLAGIVSERDYARKVILKGKSSRDTVVREIMTSSVVTVEPRHTVPECMRIMTSRRVRHLPVVDQGNIVGVVSIGDLVNSLLCAQADTIDHLRNYVTGQYPR